MTYRQTELFETDRPLTPTDRNIDVRDVPRVMGQNALIRERLRQGPATNIELAAITFKMSARISDLRAKGYQIRAERIEGGTWLYTLESEPC